MTKILVFIFILVVTCGMAFADGVSSKEGSIGFAKADINSDGALSLTEINPDSTLSKRFSDVDKDNSGDISLTEYQLFHALAEAD